jgi:hypothetical protein
MSSPMTPTVRNVEGQDHAAGPAADHADVHTTEPAPADRLELEPVYLAPGDLVSKWGFEDGDFGYEQIETWARNGYWAEMLPQDEDTESADSALRMYLSQRAFLIALVERHVVPVLPPGCRLVRIRTVHNPVRAEPTLDEDDEGYAEANDKLVAFLEQAPDVQVSGEELAALCEELFPFRSNSWLTMYQALWSNFHLVESIRTLSMTSKHLLGNDSNTFLSRYVDNLSAVHDDDELNLAAEIIRQSEDVRDHAIVDRVLASCRKLLR